MSRFSTQVSLLWKWISNTWIISGIIGIFKLFGSVFSYLFSSSTDSSGAFKEPLIQPKEVKPTEAPSPVISKPLPSNSNAVDELAERTEIHDRLSEEVKRQSGQMEENERKLQAVRVQLEELRKLNGSAIGSKQPMAQPNAGAKDISAQIEELKQLVEALLNKPSPILPAPPKPRAVRTLSGSSDGDHPVGDGESSEASHNGNGEKTPSDTSESPPPTELHKRTGSGSQLSGGASPDLTSEERSLADADSSPPLISAH